jgi:hypothetical protein
MKDKAGFNKPQAILAAASDFLLYTCVPRGR